MADTHAGKRAPGGRRAAYHHGGLRAALIAEARTLLEDQGAAGLSLRSLARRLQVSQTAFYHHFADKDALLAALAAEGFRELEHSTRVARLQGHPLDRRIRGLAAGYVRFAQKQPELFRLMYGWRQAHPERYAELTEAATGSFSALVERIAESLEEFGLAHLDPTYATMAFWALSLGLAHLLITTRLSPASAAVVRDRDQLIEQVTRIFVSGFGTPGPGLGATAGLARIPRVPSAPSGAIARRPGEPC
jgi:AcrR family transcriptional regulator